MLKSVYQAMYFSQDFSIFKKLLQPVLQYVHNNKYVLQQVLQSVHNNNYVLQPVLQSVHNNNYV